MAFSIGVDFGDLEIRQVASQDLVQATHVIRGQPTFVVQVVLLLPREEVLRDRSIHGGDRRRKQSGQTHGHKRQDFTKV